MFIQNSFTENTKPLQACNHFVKIATLNVYGTSVLCTIQLNVNRCVLLRFFRCDSTPLKTVCDKLRLVLF